MKNNIIFWIIGIIIIVLLMNQSGRQALFEEQNNLLLKQGETYTSAEHTISDVSFKYTTQWLCFGNYGSKYSPPDLSQGWVECIPPSNKGTTGTYKPYISDSMAILAVDFKYDNTNYELVAQEDPRPNAQTLPGYTPHSKSLNGIIFTFYDSWQSRNPTAQTVPTEFDLQLELEPEAFTISPIETPIEIYEKEVYNLPLRITNNIGDNLSVILGIQHSFTTPFGIQKSIILTQNLLLNKGINTVEVTLPSSVSGNASTEIQPIIRIFGANYTKIGSVTLNYNIVERAGEPIDTPILYEQKLCEEDLDCPSDAFCDTIYGLCILEIYKDNLYYQQITCENLGCEVGQICKNMVCVEKEPTNNNLLIIICLIVLVAILIIVTITKKKGR